MATPIIDKAVSSRSLSFKGSDEQGKNGFTKKLNYINRRNDLDADKLLEALDSICTLNKISYSEIKVTDERRLTPT